MNIWQNRLDNKYDVFVEPKDDGYKGDLVVKEGEKELLRIKKCDLMLRNI